MLVVHTMQGPVRAQKKEKKRGGGGEVVYFHTECKLSIFLKTSFVFHTRFWLLYCSHFEECQCEYSNFQPFVNRNQVKLSCLYQSELLCIWPQLIWGTCLPKTCFVQQIEQKKPSISGLKKKCLINFFLKFRQRLSRQVLPVSETLLQCFGHLSLPVMTHWIHFINSV